MTTRTIPEDLSRRAAAIGYRLAIDPSCGGIDVDRLDDDGPSLAGGSLAEAESFVADLESSALRARVEALGHRLVICKGLIDQNGREYAGLHILNPQADELVIISAGSAEDDAHEVNGWCEKREHGAKVFADADNNGAGARLLNRKLVLREPEHMEASVLAERIRVLAQLGREQSNDFDVGVVFGTIEETAERIEASLDSAKVQRDSAA
jgi:hypothetical protein